MKKILSAILACILALSLFLLTGCGGSDEKVTSMPSASSSSAASTEGTTESTSANTPAESSSNNAQSTSGEASTSAGNMQ